MNAEEYVVQELQETKKKLEDAQKWMDKWMDECLERRNKKETLIKELKILFEQLNFENKPGQAIYPDNQLYLYMGDDVKISKFDCPFLFELLSNISSSVQAQEEFKKMKVGDTVSFDELNNDGEIVEHYKKEKILTIVESSFKIERKPWEGFWKQNIANLIIEEEEKND